MPEFDINDQSEDCLYLNIFVPKVSSYFYRLKDSDYILSVSKISESFTSLMLMLKMWI
jgi:hypothetical protein